MHPSGEELFQEVCTQLREHGFSYILHGSMHKLDLNFHTQKFKSEICSPPPKVSLHRDFLGFWGREDKKHGERENLIFI